MAFVYFGEFASKTSARERFLFPSPLLVSNSINPPLFIFHRARSTDFEKKIEGLCTGYDIAFNIFGFPAPLRWEKRKRAGITPCFAFSNLLSSCSLMKARVVKQRPMTAKYLPLQHLLHFKLKWQRWEKIDASRRWHVEPANKLPSSFSPKYKMARRLAFGVFKVFFKDAISGLNAPKVTVPDGVVLLHQPPSCDKVPMVSNFVVKLETYLRMTEIPYENSFGPNVSSKGKIPWIKYNGKKIADSNFCIRFLNEEFKVTLDDKLSKTERAISHAIKTMVEENTYW